MDASKITPPNYGSAAVHQQKLPRSKIEGKNQPLIQSQYGFNEHECSHNHYTADRWTNLATIGEGISSGTSNFYWGISIADLISSLFISEETPPALSWGLGLGLTAFALGSMYAHRKLNIFHQHAHGHEHEPVRDQHACNHHEVEIHHYHHHHNSDERPKILSLGQKAALCADFISHTGDVCGPISAGVDAITKIALKTTLSPWGNALVQTGSTLVGAVTAVANVRSCKHAIMAQNT
jgi:hypothetical protein